MHQQLYKEKRGGRLKRAQKPKLGKQKVKEQLLLHHLTLLETLSWGFLCLLPIQPLNPSLIQRVQNQSVKKDHMPRWESLSNPRSVTSLQMAHTAWTLGAPCAPFLFQPLPSIASSLPILSRSLPPRPITTGYLNALCNRTLAQL